MKHFLHLKLHTGRMCIETNVGPELFKPSDARMCGGNPRSAWRAGRPAFPFPALLPAPKQRQLRGLRSARRRQRVAWAFYHGHINHAAFMEIGANKCL